MSVLLWVARAESCHQRPAVWITTGTASIVIQLSAPGMDEVCVTGQRLVSYELEVKKILCPYRGWLFVILSRALPLNTNLAEKERLIGGRIRDWMVLRYDQYRAGYTAVLYRISPIYQHFIPRRMILKVPFTTA